MNLKDPILSPIDGRNAWLKKLELLFERCYVVLVFYILNQRGLAKVGPEVQRNTFDQCAGIYDCIIFFSFSNYLFI